MKLWTAKAFQEIDKGFSGLVSIVPCLYWTYSSSTATWCWYHTEEDWQQTSENSNVFADLAVAP